MRTASTNDTRPASPQLIHTEVLPSADATGLHSPFTEIFWSQIFYICYVLAGKRRNQDLSFKRKGKQKDEAFTLGEGVLHHQGFLS